MTAQPARDQLRALALRKDAEEHQRDEHTPDLCGDPECVPTCVVDGAEWPCETAWLLDQFDQAEAELDSWMTRAYEAEKRAWQAEARIKAVRDSLDTYAYTGIYSGKERIATGEIRRALGSVTPPSA